MGLRRRAVVIPLPHPALLGSWAGGLTAAGLVMARVLFAPAPTLRVGSDPGANLRSWLRGWAHRPLWDRQFLGAGADAGEAETVTTFAGLQSLIRDLQEGRGDEWDVDEEALALGRLARVASTPRWIRHAGDAGELPLALELLAGEIEARCGRNRTNKDPLKAALLTLAACLPEQEADPRRAKAVARRLLQSVRDHAAADQAQAMRDRADFLIILTEQPYFQARPVRVWAEDRQPYIEHLAQVAWTLVERSQEPHLPIQHLAVNGQGVPGGVWIGGARWDSTFKRSEAVRLANSLVMALAQAAPEPLSPEMRQALWHRVQGVPTDAAQPTTAQRRAACLLARLGGLSLTLPAPEAELWRDAPMAVWRALHRLATHYPRDPAFRALGQRATQLPQVLQALAHTRPEDLATEIHHLLHLLNPSGRPPRQQIGHLDAIRRHLALRTDLRGGAFLEGIASPRDIARLLASLDGREAETEDARHTLSAQITQMPRLCQLQASLGLIETAERALARVWHAQRAREVGAPARPAPSLDDYKAQVRANAQLRLVPNHALPSLGVHRHLRLAELEG